MNVRKLKDHEVEQIISDVRNISEATQPVSPRLISKGHEAKIRCDTSKKGYRVRAISPKPFLTFAIVNKEEISPDRNAQGFWVLELHDARPDEYFFRGEEKAPIEVQTFDPNGNPHLDWQYHPAR